MCSECQSRKAEISLERSGKPHRVCLDCAHRLMKQDRGYRLIAADDRVVDDINYVLENQRNEFVGAAIRCGLI